MEPGVPKKLTAEQQKGRQRYAGRLRTPEQIEAARKYQRVWAQRNKGRKHTWRLQNPAKAREAARLSAKKARAADPVAHRAKARRYAGYPEPTRPEPDVCELCGQPNANGRALHLDHNHRTGAFRGWLCDLHNRGLGYFKDDPALLRRAAAYLEQEYVS